MATGCLLTFPEVADSELNLFLPACLRDWFPLELKEYIMRSEKALFIGGF